MGVTGSFVEVLRVFQSHENRSGLGDKIDGLVLVERQDISELTLISPQGFGWP